MANLINNIIKINRGDTYDLDITITGENGGFYKLTGQDKLYFALMEAGDEFEDAILYKIATADTTPVMYMDNDVEVIEYHFVIESNDTAHLLPDTYYYTVKLELDHDIIIDGVEPNEHVSGVYTIINRTKFIIMGATERYGTGRQQHAMTLVDQTFDENGTYLAGTYGADGFRQVTVNLTLVPETFTENGTYNAEDYGAAGFRSVTVNHQEPEGNLDVETDSAEPVEVNSAYYATVTFSLLNSASDSILEGVSLLGVTGTHRDAVIYTGNIDSITTNVHDESLLNTVNGNYSSVFGADNISNGNYNLIGGGSNKNYSDYSALLGSYNTVGQANRLSARSIAIIGHNNTIGESAGGIHIIGSKNTVISHEENSRSNVFIIGHDLTTAQDEQTLLGAFNKGIPNAVLEVGTGTRGTSRTSLYLSTDESLIIGRVSSAVDDGHEINCLTADSLVSGWRNTINRKTYGSAILGSYNRLGPASADSSISAIDYASIIGDNNILNNSYAHLIGSYLVSGRSGQVVLGRYNAEDSNARFIIGGGTDDVNRINLLTVYDTSLVSDRAASIGANLQNSIVCGYSNSIGNDVEFVNVFGGTGNTVGNNVADSTIFGYQNIIGAGSSVSNKNSNVYLFGHHLAATSDKVVFGSYNINEPQAILEVGNGFKDTATNTETRLSPFMVTKDASILVGEAITFGNDGTTSTRAETSVLSGYDNSINKNLYGCAIFGNHNRFGGTTVDTGSGIDYSFIGGGYCTINNSYSATLGYYLSSTGGSQTTVGRYNKISGAPGNVYFQVGTGSADNNRRTSFAVGYNNTNKSFLYLGDTQLTEADLIALKALIS